MKDLHLICNAHIDPVWLWDMEEGISAAISTFRMAAVFCEEYDGLVFNHNEVVVYKWIEEMEPELFARIQELVRKGKWHIMGGWYLQPDCNMPGGESFIRQMEAGREYFREKFGKQPTTAINFDPFGHSRGLVQLMAKAGFDSYLFCRPGQGDCPLPADDFIWVGFDGSEIMAHRADTYGTLMGEAGKKVEEWMDAQKRKPEEKQPLAGCMLWGVGNHGGGPSRVDLEELKALKERTGEWNLIHSTPEAYFAQRREAAKAAGREEPRVERDLNSWAVGCYTSQIRVKQKHREAEGTLSAVEKMLSQAALRGLLPYPEKELKEAQEALLFSEFHDILPGSSIQSVEEASLQMLDHGLEILNYWKRRAFFALLSGEKKAEEGEYPILIYNPHLYPVEGIFSCDFQLANQNWSESYSLPVISRDGQILESQVEKEACNMNLDWRKRVSFHAVLEPSCMNRFSARITMVDKKPGNPAYLEEEHIKEACCYSNDRIRVRINPETGLLDSYEVDGEEYLREGSGALVVMKTDCDPWGMNRHSYREELGRFRLMGKEEGSRYSGTSNERHGSAGCLIPSVRIVEDGPVKRVVEAVMEYGHSQACIRYILPARGTKLRVEIRVNWAEKGAFLKWEIPAVLKEAIPFAETAYGVMEHRSDGEEKVFHRWCGFFDKNKKRALTVINQGNYGVDFMEGAMRISLLHSAVYSAHPIGDRPLLVQDRFLPYIDQGERSFAFEINGGDSEERREFVTREAVVFQEKPMAVPAFPSGEGEKGKPVILVDNPAVVLGAFRKGTANDCYLLRLYESSGKKQTALVSLPALGLELPVAMGACEVKTLRLAADGSRLEECGIFGE